MRFRNITLVLPDGVFADSRLEVEDGLITRTEPGRLLKDMPHGLVVVPGLIDLHGDMLEREIEPRPGSRFPAELALRELDKRHVASGITTAYLAISFADFIERAENDLEARTKSLIRTVCSLRSQLGCDTRVHARFEAVYPQAAPLLGELIGQGQVQMVSLMDHSPGQGQFRDLEAYIHYMAAWLKVERRQAEAELEKQLALPKAWETVREVAALAREHSLPLASHDDDTAQKVALMRELGTTISEFPVTLEGAEAAKAQGMWTLMGAPNALRGGSHSGNLSALEALKSGLLGGLASDYYPAAMLHAAFAVANCGHAPLHEAVKLVSLNPAQVAGLLDRGSLEVGKRADFALLNVAGGPDVVATFVAGEIVYGTGLLEPFIQW